MTNPIQVWREAKNRYQYLGKTGKIAAFTRIQTPVQGFETCLPYFAAVIKLSGGRQITGQLVKEASEPKVGRRVVGILRRLRQAGGNEVMEYGVKWKIIK